MKSRSESGPFSAQMNTSSVILLFAIIFRNFPIRMHFDDLTYGQQTQLQNQVPLELQHTWYSDHSSVFYPLKQPGSCASLMSRAFFHPSLSYSHKYWELKLYVLYFFNVPKCPTRISDSSERNRAIFLQSHALHTSIWMGLELRKIHIKLSSFEIRQTRPFIVSKSSNFLPILPKKSKNHFTFGPYLHGSGWVRASTDNLYCPWSNISLWWLCQIPDLKCRNYGLISAKSNFCMIRSRARSGSSWLSFRAHE